VRRGRSVCSRMASMASVGRLEPRREPAAIWDRDLRFEVRVLLRLIAPHGREGPSGILGQNPRAPGGEEPRTGAERRSARPTGNGGRGRGGPALNTGIIAARTEMGASPQEQVLLAGCSRKQRGPILEALATNCRGPPSMRSARGGQKMNLVYGRL
jgi:hypothetical protein